MSHIPEILWKAADASKKDSIIQNYMYWLKEKKGLQFDNYNELWKWSVEDIAAFWLSFVEFAQIFDIKDVGEVFSSWDKDFIGVKWFEGVRLNYAEMIFRNANVESDAIIFQNETGRRSHISWQQLRSSVGKLSKWMKDAGIQKGDRVVSVMPNIPESVIAFLAAQSIGAIWSSCSPDFGKASILERFRQIEPRCIFITDGYTYNGKLFDKIEEWSHLIEELNTIQQVVLFPYQNDNAAMKGMTDWNSIMHANESSLFFEPLPFDHPLWILYSSGTTGIPKAITHAVGGNLIEHLKVLMLHWDVRKGEKFFWYSTTGWMMWNFSVASLLTGATLVLYDGAPAYPNMHSIWDMASSIGITHLGVGAAFVIACMKSGISFPKNHFPQLRTIGSTGSPLTEEGFEWIYSKVKKDIWLISFSGGTDICSGFVGGCILLPVYKGEIQCRLLGCSVESFDEVGIPVRNQVGEMVIQQPMPSMPLYFWNDVNDNRYRSSYFEKYAGTWWHGDFIEITDRGTVIISGRSDATLNRDGVRIGTGEIYRVLDSIEEISDSLIVCIEKKNGTFFMPLFVTLKDNVKLDDLLKKKINQALRSLCSPRHVPDAIIDVPEIPYTISGKKMETPIKKILMGGAIEKIVSKDAMKNPASLDYFCSLNL